VTASPSPPLRFGTVVIVGGGCYGTFYTRQLEAARAKGRVGFDELLIVDSDPGCRYTKEIAPGLDHRLVRQDWDDFFDEWLASESPDRPDAPDMIVPSPLMPHLMFRWLERRARRRWPGREVEVRPLLTGPGTPYDAGAPDGARYISFADWLCPVHCVEPALCPVTRAPRTWEMRDALHRWGEELGVDAVVTFHCEHQVHGVGMFSRDEVLAGDQALAQAGNRPGEAAILVGTHSSCHGAANLLHLGPGEGLIFRPTDAQPSEARHAP
jgi:hypothetical protein